MNRSEPIHKTAPRDAGMVLFIVLGGIGLLALIGLTTLGVLRTDFRITRNHRDLVAALYDAEGGVNYVKQRIEQRLTAGQSFDAIMANLNILPPAGFFFDPVTQIQRLSDSNLYAYSVSGRGGPVGTPGHRAQVTIEAGVRQDNALSIGIFGILDLRLQPNVSIYSYDSRTTPNPTPASSTGLASVGSNESISIQPNVHLDGTVALGANSAGSPAGCAGCGPYNAQEMGHIPPDPLGAVGGSLAAKFTAAAANNDNASSSNINAARLFRIPNNGSATLTSGDYYLSEMELRGDLVVDATEGPVNIYLTGEIKSWPNNDINVIGNPTDFRIYSNSNQDIVLLPRNDFRGFVYAPYAHVQMQPNGALHGAVWSKSVRLQPGGNVFIDTAILNAYKTTRLTFVSWKQI